MSFDQVYPCGLPGNKPGNFQVPSKNAADSNDRPYHGFFEDDSRGFQCVELANRFLWVADGIRPLARSELDGANYVDDEAKYNHITAPVAMDGMNGQPYLAGDVVSFKAANNPAGDGHVAVVTSSSYQPGDAGNYRIVLMEENASPTGQATAQVSGWKMQQVVTATGKPENVTAYDFLELGHVGWRAAQAPLPPGANTSDNAFLRSVVCPSDTTCVAAGDYLGSSGTEQGWLLTGSGTSWATARAPLPAHANARPNVHLYSVACPTSTICVAVGWYVDSSGNQQGLLLTGMGKSWNASRAPLPANAGASPDVYLYAVTCPAATTCLAGGAYVSKKRGFEGLLLTLSAGHWTAAGAPLPPNGTGDADIEAVACFSATSCAAAGSYADNAGHSRGLLLTRTGTSWTATEAPLPPNAGPVPDPQIYSVSCPSPASCVVAAGYYDSSEYAHGLLLTRSGTSWTATEAPLPKGASAGPETFIVSVACPSATRCVAVGKYLVSTGYTGLLLHGYGASWAATRAPLPAGAGPTEFDGLSSVACPSATSCVAVGSDESDSGSWLLTGTTTSWSPIGNPGNEGLGLVACHPTSLCVVTGQPGGRLLLTGPA